MNMSPVNARQTTKDISTLVSAEIVALNIQNHVENHVEVTKKIESAKQFLDDSFPLANGSHKNVSSYMVYYAHLLAFMNDGSQCGLRYPGQFVALGGQASEPAVIELRQNGTRIEIEFDPCGATGSQDPAGIEDIQIKVPTGDLPANGTHWISLLHGGRLAAG